MDIIRTSSDCGPSGVPRGTRAHATGTTFKGHKIRVISTSSALLYDCVKKKGCHFNSCPSPSTSQLQG